MQRPQQHDQMTLQARHPNPVERNGRLCENALGPPLLGDFGRSSVPAAPLWPSNDEENGHGSG